MPVIERLMKGITALQLEYPNSQTYSDGVEPEKGWDSANELMNAGLDRAFAKLKKYYDLTDNSSY